MLTLLLSGTAHALPTEPTWQLVGVVPGRAFGYRVAGADVDGDGLDDLLLLTAAGELGLFSGATDGLSTEATWTAAEPGLASSLVLLDLTGDGLVEPAAGAGTRDEWTGAAFAWVEPSVDSDGDGAYSPRDCDDGDPAVHPGALDLPGDGIDQDCDGQDTPAPPPEPGSPDEGPPAPQESGEQGCGCAGAGPTASLWLGGLAAGLLSRRKRKG
jgi:uncharacterized protein (TIGR03382 family)